MQANQFKQTFLMLQLITATINYGQTNADITTNSQISATLKGDTLYASTGQKYYVGQQLIVGKPSGSDGQFRSIISKKAAIVPSIWGQDKRYENAIENYVDSKKSREELIECLKTAKSLKIKKIVLSKTAKPHFYLVWLESETDMCKADIEWALRLGELLLKQ